MNNVPGRSCMAVALLIIAALIAPVTAHADLLVSPTRVVLDDRSHSAVVTLMNRSQRTHTYRIDWLEQSMDEQGRYHPIETPQASDHIASPMLRHSPRRVTIAPGEYQKVRINLRRPKDLEEGEYRSHLHLQAEPDNETAADGNAVNNGLSLQVQVSLSFSIPVIVRYGHGMPAAQISSVRVEADNSGKPQLAVGLSREGRYSAFGRIVAYLQHAGGKEERIGLANNVAVFADSRQREVTLPLQQTNFPADAVLRVVYEGDDEYEGKVWDQRSFQVGR
jgi:fimbrial chaperone protein